MRLIIFVRRNQPANHGMLQKELITGPRNSARRNAKLLLKVPISNLGENLHKFLANSDIRQLP